MHRGAGLERAAGRRSSRVSKEPLLTASIVKALCGFVAGLLLGGCWPAAFSRGVVSPDRRLCAARMVVEIKCEAAGELEREERKRK